jgi:hypothetical protein
MAEAPSNGLQTIFGFFLGLMVTSFIGVGVYTFSPSPERPFRDQQARLNRQEQAIRNSKAANALTAEDRATIQQIRDDLAKVEDASRAATEAWGRRTSIILIVLATMSMAASLMRGLQLPVIGNGLLLGGVFTMLYGVGWIIVSDQSKARFFVMTAALAITLGLGYTRFVRGRSASPVKEQILSSDSLAELDVRVRSLEDRMAAAATAFGRKDGQAGEL